MAKAPSKTADRPIPPSTLRILLVDSDSGDAARLTALLPRKGREQFTVLYAACAEEAERLLTQNRFDAVLLDLGSTVGRNGSVLRSLLDRAGDTPIVALTGSADQEAGFKAVQAGAQDFLVKSRIDADNLRRAIRYSVDRMRFRQDVDLLGREIAHRQRITEALSESQNRMLAINESLYEGVLVFDENGHIALSNRAAERLLGDSEKLISRVIDDVLRLKQGDTLLSFAQGPLRRVITQGQFMQDDDAVMVRPDGKPLAVAFACTPLLEKDGVQGAILSFRDIGAFKQAQRDALQASKLASVGQLAAGIAHEINTPIQYIGDNLTFLADAFKSLTDLLERAEQLLAAQGGDAARQAMAAMAEARESADADFLLTNIPDATRQSLEGAAQVARIVLAMKEFSHPGDREKTEEDLNRAILNTVAVSRNEWKHSAQLETNLAPDLPRVQCLAGEMNQVLLNLIVNAAHAIAEADRGGAGKITVTTLLSGQSVEIIVEDNGIGMTEQVRQQIFDPFFTTKRVGKGTGQGLAICRDVVVSKHGGKLSVESILGEGSRFTVTLPILAETRDSEDSA
jgi:PAS domain S-box-containing protein